MPAFKDEVKARLKNPENRKDKFQSNSLFDSKLDKTVKDLAKTDNKVNLTTSLIAFNFVMLSSRKSLSLGLAAKLLDQVLATTRARRVALASGIRARTPTRRSTGVGKSPTLRIGPTGLTRTGTLGTRTRRRIGPKTSTKVSQLHFCKCGSKETLKRKQLLLSLIVAWILKWL